LVILWGIFSAYPSLLYSLWKVIVTSGTKIGRANLVVANTVVTSDTPDYAIVGGTPGRILGSVNAETGALEWFSKDDLEPQTKHKQTDPGEVDYETLLQIEREKREELEAKHRQKEETLRELSVHCMLLEDRLEKLEAFFVNKSDAKYLRGFTNRLLRRKGPQHGQ
jgi:hypothetical protein